MLRYLMTALPVASFLMTATAPEPVQARVAFDFSEQAEELLPSVVNISTTQQGQARAQAQVITPQQMPKFPPGSPFEEMFKDFFDNGTPQQRSRKITSLGSGFIIDKSGLVVTNNHVIDEADKITVILNDKTELPATIVGADTKTDLALLQVKTDRPLTAIRWGNSDKAKVGEWVLAIGNPFGLGGSVTAGIISARARNINAGPYDDFIQTDAAINRGNSGGPMFNEDGELIGINTAIYSPTGGSVGIGFAIPSNLARPVLEQLKKSGKVQRGWLGVQIQPVNREIADSFGLPTVKGALVSLVNKGTPAEKAGIKDGDIILSFDGVDISEMRALPRQVASTPVGKTVPVAVWRNGREMSLRVTIAEMKATDEGEKTGSAEQDEAPLAASALYFYGMRMVGLSKEIRQQYEMPPELQGVLLLEVNAVSAASDKGLKEGDVLVELNQQPVRTPEEVRSRLKSLVQAGKKTALFRVVTESGDRVFVALPLPERFGERDG